MDDIYRLGEIRDKLRSKMLSKDERKKLKDEESQIKEKLKREADDRAVGIFTPGHPCYDEDLDKKRKIEDYNNELNKIINEE